MVHAFSSLLTSLPDNPLNASQTEVQTPVLPRKTSGISAVLGKDGRYSCPYERCSQTYEGPKSVIRHYKTIHLGITFACPKCGQQWLDKRGLLRHVCKHTPPDKYPGTILLLGLALCLCSCVVWYSL